MKTLPRIGIAISLACLVSACASPTVVQAVKPGDTGLSCAQLKNEFADAERYRQEADKEKSVTGGNVVRAIFFWPAILGTAANANEAIAAADNRKVYLANQMSNKNCDASTTDGQSKEVQLTDLKRLFDANLISKEAYNDKQKAILDSR